MKKSILTLAAAAVMALGASAYTPLTLPVIPPDPELEARVAKTLASMTLEQKVGQMLQLQIDKAGRFAKDGTFSIDPAKLDSLISNYKVGSFLNTPGSSSLSAAEWDVVISTIQEASMRLNDGIPVIYGLDEIHGTTYVNDGVLYPQGINMGATFDTELVRSSSETTAYLTRAADVPWTFSPTVDLARDPRWPRFWENYGEDPLVNALMGAAAVRGFQGDDPNHVDRNHIAVSLKHYMAYGSPFSGKDRTPAYIAPSELKDKYFAPFLEGIKNGALTVMVNSASINGVPVHASWEYLTKRLKNDLQWDGLIVTDWADINNLYTREHVAKDKKDAIRIAINAGIDMAMEPYQADFCTLLIELVNEGKVSMERIDDATARNLRLKYRLGLFDRPNTTLAEYPDFHSDRWDKEAYRAAVRSMVLLKNNADILPLKPGTKMLVTGPTATSMRALNGGWSYSWQGHLADTRAERYNTIAEALTARFGADAVTYVPTVTFPQKGDWWAEEVAPSYDPALEAAAGADVIIACVGENSYCESKGNLSNLYLSENQREMVRRLASTGKPVILILNEGRPRILGDIVAMSQAVVASMLPGNMGGDALAALLGGDENFSGRLPFTYPREINSLVTYDYKTSEEAPKMEGAYDYDARVNIEWPFGYGRSYTTFEYSNMHVDKPRFNASDILTVTLDVTNTGTRDGIEAVLLFSTDHVASVIPDNKRLRAFTTLALMPGETRAVRFEIPASDLAFVGADDLWTLEEGTFTLTASPSSGPQPTSSATQPSSSATQSSSSASRSSSGARSSSSGTLSVPIYCTSTTTWPTPNIQ